MSRSPKRTIYEITSQQERRANKPARPGERRSGLKSAYTELAPANRVPQAPESFSWLHFKRSQWRWPRPNSQFQVPTKSTRSSLRVARGCRVGCVSALAAAAPSPLAEAGSSRRLRLSRNGYYGRLACSSSVPCALTSTLRRPGQLVRRGRPTLAPPPAPHPVLSGTHSCRAHRASREA